MRKNKKKRRKISRLLLEKPDDETEAEIFLMMGKPGGKRKTDESEGVVKSQTPLNQRTTSFRPLIFLT